MLALKENCIVFYNQITSFLSLSSFVFMVLMDILSFLLEHFPKQKWSQMY